MQQNYQDGRKYVLPIKYKFHFKVKMSANPHNDELNGDSGQNSKSSL